MDKSGDGKILRLSAQVCLMSSKNSFHATQSKIPEESAVGTELHEDILSLSQHARSSQTARRGTFKANILYCGEAGVAGRIISLFAHDENRRVLI